MVTNIEQLEKSMVKITIEVEAERFEEGLQHAYNTNKNKISVQGFRKGKAPRALVEKMYGSNVFYEDAANFLIPKAYEEAIKGSELKIVSQPEIAIEQIEKTKSFIFTATVAVKPEVKLGEYKGLEATKQETEVSEEDIQVEIEKVREQNSRLITITDRPIKDKDEVIIDFEGFVDGVAFEGGTAENYTLVIGSHSFIDTFEEQLIDKNIDEEVEVNVTFPEEYQKADLQGKEAMFKVKIKEIKEKEFPVVDDEFAKDVSEFDTLDEYKEDIKDKLKKQKENEADQNKRQELLNKAVENAELEIPEPMIELQAEQMFEDFEQRIKYQGLSLEQYLSYFGQNVYTMKQQFKPEAEKRIKGRLVLEAIAITENIEVTDEEINNEIVKLAESYKVEIEKLKEAISETEKENMKEDIAIQKAYDLLVESAVEVEKQN